MKKLGRKVRRSLSLALAIMLIVTMIPQFAISAYGEELDEEITIESNDESKETSEEDIDELGTGDSEELLTEDIFEEEMSFQAGGESSIVHFGMYGEGLIKSDDRASAQYGTYNDGWNDYLDFELIETESGKYTIGFDVDELQVKNDYLEPKGYVFKGWYEWDINENKPLDIPFPEDGIFDSNEKIYYYGPIWGNDNNDVFFTFDPDGGEFSRSAIEAEQSFYNIYFGEPEEMPEDIATFDLKTPIKYKYDNDNHQLISQAGPGALAPQKDNVSLMGWYLKKADGSPDMSRDYDRFMLNNYDREITEDVTFIAVYNASENPTVTFDANGGIMKLDPKAINVVGETEDGYCEKQSFYYSYDADTGSYRIDWSGPIDDIKPPYENCSFAGWADDVFGGYIDEDYSFEAGISRTCHADWWRDMTDLTPNPDTSFGQNGIDYIWDKDSNGKDRLSVSFRVPKSDYEDIYLSDDEILKLVFYYGTKKANLKNSTADKSGTYPGYYRGWNAETVKDSDGLRTAPVTSGMDGEKHEFSDDYFTVTLPFFCPYDGKYSDNIYVGLEYVIQNKSDCENQEEETINWDKAIEGQKYEGLYKKNSVLIKLQYPTGKAMTQIKNGSTVIEPAGTQAISEQLTEASYVLDGTKTYTLATEAVTGYKISKVSYRNGSTATPTIWSSSLTLSTTKSFKPSVDNSVISIESAEVYSPILKNGDVELAPDANGVYSASYIDTIKFEIKKGTNTIAPGKIVTKFGSKVVETLEEGGSLKFNGSGVYHGQKVTVELYEAGIEKAVTTCYVQVTAPIRSVTLKNTKVLNPAIEGAPVTSVVTVNKGADVNKLGFVCLQGMVEPDFVDVSLENGVLTITPKENCATNKSFDIYFYNSEEVPDPKWWAFGEIEGGRFGVTMQPPAWANKTPNASLVFANDYQLDFKVTAPSGVKLNDKYYVAVKLISNKNTAKGLKAGLAVNETVKYFKINEDGTFPQVSLNAFTSGGSEVETLGEGCGASMDAEFYVVKTLDGDVPNTDESNVLASTVSKNHKKLTVSTKAPYYAEKITFKKTAAASKLYAGQSMVKVADVNLGNNTTFNTTDYWTITSIVDPSGAEILGVTNIITVATGEAAGKSKTDTGIYLDLLETINPGKYKVKVSPKVGETVIPNEAVLDITVVPTIGRLDASVNGVKTDEYDSYRVYKAAGKKSNVKSIVSATDQEGKKINKPTVKYVVGVLNYTGDDIVATNVPGLTVDKSGTISITNDFKAKEGETYALMVKAADYEENSVKKIVKLDIYTEPVNVKTLEVYTKEGESYKLVNGKTAIPFDSNQIFVAVKNNKNEYVLGSADAPIYLYDADTLKNDKVFVDISAFVSALGKLTKPGNVKLTAYGMDGTKATADIKFTYASINMDFDKIKVAIPGETGQSFEENGNLSFDGYPTNQKICIWLTGSYENAYDEETDTHLLVEGSLKVNGAKILKNSNSQYLEIQMTKSPATVTLNKKAEDGKKTIAKTVTLTNNAFSQVAAPAVSSVLINGTDKVYADYIYDYETDKLRITLKDVIRDASKNKVNPDTVKVATADESGEVFEPNTASYHVVQNAKGNDVAYVELPIELQYTAQQYKVSLFYYTGEAEDEYSFLTKTPTVVSFTPAKFKTSFSITATQNMSQKDAYAIYPLYKGTGVVNATLVGLNNFNSKGQYSEFTQAYKCEDGQLKVNDPSKINATNNVGYMNFEVLFENGKTEYYSSKVTVKWSEKELNRYTADKPTITVGNSDPIQLTVKNGTDTVVVKKVMLSKVSPSISDVSAEDGKINVTLSETACNKAGTYKADLLIITDKAGNPESDDFSKYGIKVPISIVVKK